MGTPFEEFLLQRHFLASRDLASARERQQKMGGTLDTALLESDVVDEVRALMALSAAFGRRAMDLSDVEPSMRVKEHLPARVAEKLSCVPLSFEEGVLHLAFTYPFVEEHVKKLEGLLKTPIKPWVALECRIRDWAQRLYGIELPERFKALLEKLQSRSPSVAEDDWVGAQPIEITVETTQWTLDEARAQLAHAAPDFGQLLEAAMHFAHQTFTYVAVFSVQGGMARLEKHKGAPRQAKDVTHLSIPLDAPSVFRTVAQSHGSYVGPVPADEFTRHFIDIMGRSPKSLFLYPVDVRGKIAAILYCDNGKAPIRQRAFAELVLFCEELSTAFQECILQKKERDTANKALATKPSKKGKTAPQTLNFDLLMQKLWGPDISRRTEALQELTTAPEAAAEVLTRHFPGPTIWPRTVLSELPSADELGPLPSALTWLGKAGTSALGPLLASDDSDTRYMALLTAGNMPAPELLEGVMKSLFDLEPELASAARAAAPAFRDLPGFHEAVAQVRDALDSAVPLRKTLAIRALGALRDVECIERLITLTAHDSTQVAHSAADALALITCTSFGVHAQQWKSWWALNHTKPRSEWLLASLRHPDVAIRQRAIDELSSSRQDTLGYAADAPMSERDAAARRWENALRAQPALVEPFRN